MRARYLLPTLFLGCVEVTAPPEPTPSVPLNYGSRIFLSDPQADFKCKVAGPVATGEGGQITVAGVPINDPTFSLEETNCFVKVVPGTLWFDAHEVTNEQFQLCVDSGACNNPVPSDANKTNTCESADAFDKCPVIGVPQFEAEHYCEFVGRRLPSGVEHIIARERVRLGNYITSPSTPDLVPQYPTGNTPPTSDCNAGVLANCGKPQAVESTEPGDIRGAASLDVTPDGVFDLMGNVSEWASDLIPPLRTTDLEGFPWFCAQPLPKEGADAGKCPAGEVCVYGRRQTGALVDDAAPVCITTPDLVIRSGALGTFAGGNFDVSEREPNSAGTFAHRVLDEAGAQNTGTAINGIRCAGKSGGRVQDSIVGVP